MSLSDFVKHLSTLITGISKKQSKGVIALLIQPTQWDAPERRVVDHVIDIIKAVKVRRLRLERRISCPYPTEQYNAQQSTWPKENKELLVLTREQIVSGATTVISSNLGCNKNALMWWAWREGKAGSNFRDTSQKALKHERELII